MVPQMERRPRILVVDDEERVALTLCKGLRKLPHCEVQVAASGEAGLALFAQEPFDLLVTDYRMPVIDGLMLAEQVRRRFPRTVIILITAHNGEDLRQRNDTGAIFRILDKPVGLREIRAVVCEALNRSEGFSGRLDDFQG